jgi:hypothetical protein
MTAARRLPAVVWAVAAVALWLAWSTAEVGAGPLEPTLCPVGSADPACAQPVVNRPPDAVDDTVRSRPGRTIRTNVLGNDSDPDGDALTVRPNRNRTFAGTFSFAADGAFAYTPRYGFAGTDGVSYEVSDGRGASDAATVWVHVENARPVVQDEHFTIRPGETLRGNLLANDVDPDGDTMSVTSRFDVKRDGSFTYTPAPGFIGRDGGGYAVEDQYGLIAGGRIVIDVVNRAPVAASHRFRIRNDETASGNVLVDASDPDGDPIRLHPFSVTADARSKEGGLVRIDRDGGFNYLPPAGFAGRDSFGYTIIDSYQAVGSGTVTVEVAANRRPVAGDDGFRIRPNGPLRGSVLGNDFDLDGDTLRVNPKNDEAFGGHVDLGADGSFTYTPTPRFAGVFSFEYTVSDGRGGSDVGAVDIEVVNRPPVAVADRFTTSPGHALSAGLLGNDSDPDGDALSTGTGTISTAAGGQVTFYGDGLFLYRTPAGFVGVDRFQYGLVDSYGSWDVGEVTVGVGVPA